MRHMPVAEAVDKATKRSPSENSWVLEKMASLVAAMGDTCLLGVPKTTFWYSFRSRENEPHAHSRGRREGDKAVTF